MCTIGREATIHWYRNLQQKWFYDTTIAIYGNLQTAKHMERGRPHLYNSFNLYARHAQCSFAEIGPFSRRLGPQLKIDIRELALELNKD